MIMLKMLLGVMTLVAVMVIMLVDDNVDRMMTLVAVMVIMLVDEEDVVRSDDIGGSDGNNVDR